LNRPQLLLHRRELIINKKHENIISRITNQIPELKRMTTQGDVIANQYLTELLSTLLSINVLNIKKNGTPPYKAEQIKRIS
ncbi:MAG TPA: hypothetical protein VK255_04545, partial [Patescibacteria group bacterium]|nr:hypothetical protein [Patescibacteria group bacterium]